MKQVIIGILPTSNYMVTDDTFKDTYRFGNNYIKKILENEALPFLIPLVDEKMIPDALEMCDGLLVPGGSRIRPVDFEIVDYFYKKKKPILGICMGMQLLAMYSVNLKEKKRILKRIDNGFNHWPIELLRSNNTSLVHKDLVVKNSKMYDILNRETIEVNSVHHYTISEVGDLFDVSIVSEDGLIEGIECKDSNYFMMGVQFHPEILPQFNELFKRFIIECKKK